MDGQGAMGGFYRVAERIMLFAYLNILWILFTLLGLIVLGIMPSTIAMLTVYRKWLMGERDTPIFRLYAKTYKNEFFKGNGLGLFLVIIGYILYVDFVYLGTVEGILNHIFTAVLFIAGILYLLLLAYLIPVYVHYDLKFFQYIKQSLMIGVISPLMTILMLLSLIALYFVFRMIPGLIPLFSFSVIGFIIMGNAYYAFVRLERRKEDLEEVVSEGV